MKNIIIILLSIILFVLFGFTTGSYEYNPWFLFINYFIYAIFIVLLHKKSLNYKLPLITIVTIVLVILILKYISEGSLVFLDISTYIFLSLIILFYVIAVQFAKKTKYSILFGSCFIVINYILCFYIYFFVINYSIYGTYNGMYDYNIKNTIIFKDDKGIPKQLDNNKVYVIDFWNKTCGVCFKKFPKFDRLKSKYSDVNNIEFIAVNIYNSENDIEYSQKLFDKTNLDFKTYYIDKKDSKELKADFFPTTIVIKNGKIIFKGHIETLNALRFIYL